MPMKMEQTECSETSAYKLQTPGNYPKESIQHYAYDFSRNKPNFDPQSYALIKQQILLVAAK